MKQKLFLSYLVIIIAALSISLTTFWGKGYSLISNQSKDYYRMQAEYLGNIFSYETEETGMEEFVKTHSENKKVRLTLINKEGEVYMDSSKEGALENHKDREEVQKALAGEQGFVTRYSSTMGQVYCYSAVPVKNSFFEGVLRLSVPMREITAMRRYIIESSVLVVLVCFGAALFIAYIFSKRLTNPIEDITQAAEKISNGDYDIVINAKQKDQIGRLAGAFNRMSKSLKENMQKLKKRNIELETMLSSIQGAVAAIDMEYRILFYNKRFEEMNGKGEIEYLGRHFFEEVQNETMRRAVAFAREKETGTVEEGSFGEYSIRVTATPLAGENAVIGVLLIVEDMTQIRRLENVRSEFVSNVTHELKTPLTSIRGFVDTLKNGAVQDEAVARRFLDIIDIEVERLTSLIQDILLLSEIESKKNPETETCDVNRTVREVAELLEGKFTDDVELVLNIEPYIRPYSCNPGRLKELLINLLDNARKYTEKGGVTLTVKEENKTLMIEVRDTGIGMEKEHLPRIFERFYRVDKSRSRKQGGTGLGLSIVKHIVELYNGNIKVESHPGAGTVFTIYLPY